MTAESTVRPARYLVCVDQQPESRVALRLACAKARSRGGVVDIAHVIPPSEFPTLLGVAERMQEEQKQEAEQFLQQLAEEAFNLSGISPRLILRQGAVGDEILAAAIEDVEANMLVVGVAQGTPGRGKLVSWLALQLGSKLFMPMLLVPGNLTDDQLAALI